MNRRILGTGLILVFWGLSASILLTILAFDLGYPLFLEAWDLPVRLGWPAQDLARQVDVLMDYLTLPWVTELKFPDLPSSESGLYHFFVVKLLFHFCQVVFFGTSIGMVITKPWRWLPSSWYRTWILLPLGLAFLAVLVGFDQFFIWFHQILFPGDSSWLFDPAKDPIILLLPQDAFMLAFVFCGILYELYFLAWYIYAKRKDRR